MNDDQKQEIARAFEDAAIGVLIEKTRKALEEFHPRTLIIGGGVSANAFLRTSLENLIQEFPETELLIPTKALTTDNAVMIGMAAYISIQTGRAETTSLQARGRLPL